MLTPNTAVMAIAPAIVLVWYFHRHDRFPEPPGVLWMTFLLGAASAIVAGLIEFRLADLVRPMIHGDGPIAKGLVTAFLLAAIPEELCKAFVLLLYSFRRKAFDEEMDGIVYGAVAATGFATIENLGYVAQGGVGIAVMRALTSVPMHAFMGAIAGYYLGRAVLSLRAGQSDGVLGKAIGGIAAAMLLHGIYDFPLLAAEAGRDAKVEASGEAALAGLAFFLTALIVAWRWTSRLVRRSEAGQESLLPPEQHAIDMRRRIRGLRRRGAIKAVLGGFGAALFGALSVGLLVAAIADFAQSPARSFGTGLVMPFIGIALVGGLPGLLAILLLRSGIHQQNEALRQLAAMQAVAWVPSGATPLVAPSG
ncbi:MAG TPA: PrsW family intramembrane metalloprotease [Thermoanaerobaculia bacterium]|nr:PrsW family intramembrane metalloprotease [Thermoanaerobaculia bacterium]